MGEPIELMTKMTVSDRIDPNYLLRYVDLTNALSVLINEFSFLPPDVVVYTLEAKAREFAAITRLPGAYKPPPEKADA